MMAKKPSRFGRKQQFDPERVRDVSVEVYKLRLEASSKGAVKRLSEKHGAAWLRESAVSYDTLTRVYLKVLNPDGEAT
jgi:hypothetical protein